MKLRHLPKAAEKGQGLVEYAFILALVAVVVIAILLTLGPVVGNVFSKIHTALFGPNSGGGQINAITTVTAIRQGGGNSLNVTVTVAVSTNTTITLSDSNNAINSANPQACSATCTFQVQTANAGTVTATDSGGGAKSANYPAKN
jgi:pilus assembly protein Flp/PilA